MLRSTFQGLGATKAACVLLAGTLLVSVGCAGPQGPYTWVKDIPPGDQVRRIESGDTIAVVVRNQRELSGNFVVRENGAYAQPVVGQVRVAGMSEKDAAKFIAKLLGKDIVVNPRVDVTVISPRPVRVAVVGEVTTSGQYTVEANETLLSVLARAGGLSAFANRDAIFVIRQRPKLERIRFRYNDLKGADSKSTLFRLHDGDVIVVE